MFWGEIAPGEPVKMQVEKLGYRFNWQLFLSVFYQLAAPAVDNLKKTAYFEAILNTCREIINFLDGK